MTVNQLSPALELKIAALASLCDPEQRRKCTGNRTMMLGLTLSFPALADYPHVTWDPDEFVAWARAECHASSEWHAAVFVVAVWNVHLAREMSAPKGMRKPRANGRGFDAIEALVKWDSHNREAFLAWARDPWWA
jgi:hypothetical protein